MTATFSPDTVPAGSAAPPPAQSNVVPVPGGEWSTYPARPLYLQWADTAGNISVLWFDVVVSEQWDEDAEVTEHPVEQGANIGDHVRVALVKCSLKVRSSNEPLDGNAFAQNQRSPVVVQVPTPSWVRGPGVVNVKNWVNPIELRALGASLVGLAGSAIGGATKSTAVAPVAGLVGLAAASALFPAYGITLPVNTTAGLAPPTRGLAPLATVQTSTSPTDFVAQMHLTLKSIKDAAQLVDVYGTKGTQTGMVIESLSFTRDVDTGTGEDIAIGLKEVRIVSTQQVTAPILHISAGGGKPPVNHGGQAPTPFTSAQLVTWSYQLFHSQTTPPP